MPTGTIYTLDTTQAEEALTRLAAKDNAFREAMQRGLAAEKQTRAEAVRQMLEYQNRLSAVRNEYVASRAIVAEQAAELRKLISAERELNAERKKSTAEAERQRINKLLRENQAEQKRLTTIIAESKVAVEQERAAVDKLRESRRQEVAQTRLSAAAAKDAAAAAKQEATDSKGGLLGGLLIRLGPVAAGLLTVNKLVGAVRQGLNDYAALSGLENTFKALTGSASGAASEIAFLRAESNRLGLELIPTAQAYTGLFASAKEANLPLSVTRELFTGLTSAGRVLNKSQADVESAIRAVEQIISKGTVSSQELKLQLGNALPGAFSLAAKAAGLTTAELTKQLEAGKLLANDFLPKFAKQLQSSYGAGTADAASSATANLGRINTFLQSQSAKFGSFFNPLLKSLADLVSGTETAAQKSDRLVGAFQRENEGVRQLQQVTRPLVDRYEELSKVSDLNVTQQKELDTVIQELAKTVPGAVTQFDAYGKALGINAGAVRQFIKDQENLVRYNNADRLKQNSAALQDLLKQANALRRELANTETDATTGLKRRRIDVNVDGEIARSSLLSQAESDKITNDLTTQLGKVQDDIRANLQNRQLLRGKSPLLPTPNPTDVKAALGVIEELRKKIQAEREKLDKLKGTAGEPGFEVARKALVAQIASDEKELDRLLGKVEKSSKAVVDKLTPALRALAQERLTLLGLAEKASIRVATDERERAEQQLQADLRAVELVKQKLIERERAVRAAGGRGERADGVIDGVQEQQLNTLREAAAQRHTDELFRIEQVRYDRLLDLSIDSEAKQRELIERRYEKEREAAIHQSDVLQALEAAKQNELLRLEADFEQQRLELRRTLETANAQTRGATFGTGTGRGQRTAQMQERLDLIAIEEEFQRNEIANSVKFEAKKGEAIRAEARKQLALLAQERKKAEQDAAQFDIYKLILGEEANEDENREALDQAVSASLQAINTILQANQQAAQAKIDAKTREIDDLERNLDRELQFNKEGSASNIAGLRAEITAAKAARREALEDQKKAAKQQQLVQDLQAVSAIANAVANIIAGWSTVPLVGSILGIAAAGAMIASFVAVKAKAKQAAQSNAEGFFKGGYTGGTDVREERGVVHGKEFVHTADVTQKYRTPLFEALHRNRPQDIDWQHPRMQALLPDYALPSRLQAEKRAAVEQRLSVQFAPMQEKFDAMQRELAEIRQQVTTTANRRDVVPVTGGYLEVDPTTKSTTLTRLEGLQ